MSTTMSVYRLTVSVQQSKSIKVEAETAEKAKQVAMDMYHNDKIDFCPDTCDFSNLEIY